MFFNVFGCFFVVLLGFLGRFDPNLAFPWVLGGLSVLVGGCKPFGKEKPLGAHLRSFKEAEAVVRGRVLLKFGYWFLVFVDLGLFFC